MHIDSFPTDSLVRVIIWVDRIQWPTHEATTPVIEVLLRTTPPGMTLEQVLAQSPAEVSQWMASSVAGERFDCALVLIGLLPFLRMGDVVFEGRIVGSLQMNPFRLTLTESDTAEIKAMPTAGDPKRTHAGYSSRSGSLYPSEYRLHTLRFMASRLLDLQTEDEVFLLPRSEILRRFYAVTSEWIRAMVEGPWDLTWERVIHGVEDRRELAGTPDSPPGGIRVTLPHGRPPWLGFPAAIFSATEFGARCANEIHGALVHDFDITGSQPVAFASARIPIEATAQKPTEIKVLGWTVKGGYRPRILIARVVDCKPSSPVGPIYVDRPQRSDDDPDLQDSVARIPPGLRLAPDNQVQSTLVDANQSLGQFENRTDDPPVWMVPPVVRVPSPPRAKPRPKYLPVGRHCDGNAASAGRPGSRGGNPAVSTATSSRQTKRSDFFHLMELLRHVPGLTATILSPPAGRGRTVDGWPCWAFRSPTTAPDAHGWWTIRKERRHDGNMSRVIPRCALVLQLKSLVNTGYWVEIQTRASEAYHAVIVPRIVGDATKVINDLLSRIVIFEGRLLGHQDDLVSGLGISADLVRHRRDDEDQRYTREVVHQALAANGLVANDHRYASSLTS